MDGATSSVHLSDKYEVPSGRLYMTGTQALVRLLLAQKARDEAAGLQTEGFVSGYRGSPIGGFDQELWRNADRLERHGIRFAPGLNEELAATAVWGTQMVTLDPAARVDGVFSLWYGKGPGVDRCGDVFKHANAAGCSAQGGVLLVAGDDHACKSSTLPHQSEHALIAAMIPVLYPADLSDFLELGLHGYAMSRYSGCWIGFKVISDTIESSATFEANPALVTIRVPDSYPVPAGGFAIRWPDAPLQQENRLQRERIYALLDYVRVNRLNRVIWPSPGARLGIVTAGKSYLDVREALTLMGIDEARAATIGLRLLKVGLIWPLEPRCIETFSEGLEEILVVEEKRQVLEYQIKEHLYNQERRPRVVGKYDEVGEWIQVPRSHILLSPNGELNASQIAAVIAGRLQKLGLVDASLALPALPQVHVVATDPGVAGLPQRTPYYCSGCPHNTSTKVPTGSRALAGIGCHYMVLNMHRRTETFSQMGGEGVTWIGQAPFTNTPHVFVNLGDGTFIHSGSLAIRAALAAGVNVTYKLLVNDAVAMTGGQPIEGAPTVARLLHLVAAEGVTRLHLVSDHPEQFAPAELPAHTRISHRDELEGLQQQLRRESGVSVIVYVQTCAAEKRRRRKQGRLADPLRRVMINEAVCEGCGDCGERSNCVSIVPLETALGRKRAIDQGSCNKDYACLDGFCPSFVTVDGAALRRPGGAGLAHRTDLPAPASVSPADPCNILIVGVGGTGVVTVAAILGMAAHIEGRQVRGLDMAGLAQKGGTVMSHLRIANGLDMLHATRVPAGQADLVLGCDLMACASAEARFTMSTGRSLAFVNADVTPTGDFTHQPDWQAQPERLLRTVSACVARIESIAATSLTTVLIGDPVSSNLFLLGFAWQRGAVPLGCAAIEQAITLNGASVRANLAAFHWGRQAACDPDSLPASGAPAGQDSQAATLKEVITDRSARLSRYQDAAYAQRYAQSVERCLRLLGAVPDNDDIAIAVAQSLYHLMAYKDEYEVARLHLHEGFLERLGERFEPGYRITFHLAPPLLGRRDANGLPRKTAFGPWVLWLFRVLVPWRRWRGTWLDPFGWTRERREERQAIADYERCMLEVLPRLTRGNRDTVRAIASLPRSVRGFGHVKARQRALARQSLAGLMSQLEPAGPAGPTQAVSEGQPAP